MHFTIRSTLLWSAFLAGVVLVERSVVAQMAAGPPLAPPLLAPSPIVEASPFADTADEPANSWDAPIQDSASLRKFVQSIAVNHLPVRYENTKQWGQTKKVFSGLKVSLDGLRVDSERRTKEVNHGTWKRYRIDLAPGPDSLQLVVDRVEQKEDGRLHVDLSCRAKLFAFGRVAQWERGVQLMSLGADADADVRLNAGCDVGVLIDPLKLPPDVKLVPHVTDAKLELIDFRLRRLGHMEGPVAKQLGRGLEEVLQERIEDENRHLADKLNRQLAKKQDRLRFSLHDWLARKWDLLQP